MATPHIFLHVTNILINVAVYSVFSFKKAKQNKNNVSCKHICGGAIWNSFPILTQTYTSFGCSTPDSPAHKPIHLLVVRHLTALPTSLFLTSNSAVKVNNITF